MSSHSGSSNLSAAIAAMLTLTALNPSSQPTLTGGRARSGDTPYTQPGTEPPAPVRTTSTVRINDPACPSGKRWVTYIYIDGTQVDTQYGDCV
jgi:hypothetical protein